ncbi:MAG TPA: hypothetical protein VLY63_26475, partial [Anaerolineae bacterium]|nr:hypothetical protein [Anaerolineae bacterium]
MTTALLFVLWGTGFIYRVSVVAIDGTRYFCLIDDAMISMRYAWNLTHGIGLVWNAGERVEGYSNLLMVLLMAIPSAFLDKSAAVLAVQLAGIFTMLGNAWLSMKIFRMITRKSQEPRADAFQVVAFAMPLLYYPLVFWTLMGMETGLLALLLYWAIYASLRFRMDGIHRELWWSSLALGLAYLTRNDSLIFALLVFGFMWNPGRKTWRAGLRALLPGGVVYGGFIALQALFRYLYYGSIMPNTYFLKLVGMPLLARLENGAGFLTPFLGEVAFLLTAGMLSAIWRPSLQKAYLSAFLLAALAYEMYAGGDYYNYWRFMAPAIPLVLVVVLHALGDALARRPVWKFSGSQRAALNRPSPGWQRAGVLAVVM